MGASGRRFKQSKFGDWQDICLKVAGKPGAEKTNVGENLKAIRIILHGGSAGRDVGSGQFKLRKQ